MLGRQGCQEPVHFFGAVRVWKFFGLGFFGVQVMAGNNCGEGWGVRGIPQVPGAPHTMRGAEFSAWPGFASLERDASSGNGNAASPPLHSRSRTGLQAQQPPSSGAEEDPEKETPPAPERGQDGPWLPSHPPRRTLGIRKEQENPTAKTSGTFNPGAPGRAFCSPRAEPRAPRRFRTPLPGRFHGNHTNMLISVLQPSRPQLIDRGDQPC